MCPYQKFRLECEEEARAQGADPQFLATTREWFDQSMHMKYSYHFEWMGRPIIQFPQDTVAEWLSESYFDVSDRRCGPGNSPMTAVQAFLADHPGFEADHSITDKLMITVSPGGYLQSVS